MLQQRTWVHFAQWDRSVFLARHHFELWPSTSWYLFCLVLRNTCAASSPPASDPNNKRNLQLQPNARHVFSARIRPFLPKTLPLPASVWPLEDLLRRGCPFRKTLPLLFEFDLWTEYFVEPPRAFFSSGDYSITLSDDFDTAWPSGDSSKPSCFLWRFIIVRSLQSFSDIVIWERIVFCFVAVSSCVFKYLILEWIIAHYFLFLCGISFCMYLFDNFSSSSVDKFVSTRLKSISSALVLPVSLGRHAKLIENFSHESDVTSLKTPF